MASLAEVVALLDAELRTSQVPDYEGAVNGLQLANGGEVRTVAAAVDFSLPTVQGAVAAGADLLIVHHGMFWGGARPFVGAAYHRLRTALDSGLAVYASHLPLDAHPTLGNNVLLARELGLEAQVGFGRYKDVLVGVSGTSDVPTEHLVTRTRAFAERLGSHVVATPYASGHRTSRWALITGAGASSATIAEAHDNAVDTLIVGEGPHHTAVEAMERGMVVIYAGHYATETLGVQAVARMLGDRFSIPWTFVHVPTGL